MPHTRWEYCILSTPPPGPVQVYISYMRPEGMRREVHDARSYQDGVERLWPSIVAQMGLAGWELVFVDQSGAYYMRRPALPAQV